MLSAVAAHGAPQKPIRLRNQVVTAKSPGLIPSSANAPATGLFLIQFRESLKPEWREQLRLRGVNLLRYVPDDAFVARFVNVHVNEVQALGFVQFIGEYRAEHKVNRRLREHSNALPSGATSEIAILLAPGANDADAAQAKAHFNQFHQETKLRSGRILRGFVTPAQLDALAASDQVLWIEPSPKMKLNDEVSSKIVAGDGGPNLLAVQALGFDGSGVKVAVADSGLNKVTALTSRASSPATARPAK
jgi:hypothetical protein